MCVAFHLSTAILPLAPSEGGDTLVRLDTILGYIVCFHQNLNSKAISKPPLLEGRESNAFED
jgi:hypothetical protein